MVMITSTRAMMVCWPVQLASEPVGPKSAEKAIRSVPARNSVNGYVALPLATGDVYVPLSSPPVPTFTSIFEQRSLHHAPEKSIGGWARAIDAVQSANIAATRI